MIKTLAILFLILNLGWSLTLTEINEIKNWELLKDDHVKIQCAEFKGYRISKAEMIFNHNIDLISLKIEDIENYPNIFERVTTTKRLDKDIIQVVLDLPFPFSGRDYVIKHRKEILENNDLWVFTFDSILHPKARLERGHVRLPNATGIWILKPISLGITKVTYAWNGELLGNFPDAGLQRAWITQGTEVLVWLEKSLKNVNE